MNRPIVGITACRIEVDGRIHHAALERYVGAVSAAAGALPLLVPAVGRTVAGDDLLDAIDGLLFTGSPSNVLPRHYDTPPSRPGTRHDPHRDETTLPLVRGCLERGVPLLAVCRGFQEVNVALGGTLHQHVQELPGMLDHRVDPSLDLAGQYAPVHAVQVVRGGFLHRLVGREAIEVNSLHSQGIDRLAGAAGGRGAGAGRSRRGGEHCGSRVVRPRGAVASGMERAEGSGLARDVRGVRGGGSRARRMAARRPGRDATAPERMTTGRECFARAQS